jgi:hypothetical protein
MVLPSHLYCPTLPLKLHVYPSYHKPHPLILSGDWISFAFVQVILDGCLKRWNFLGKEKQEKKKRN